jgi:hypothetical protein
MIPLFADAFFFVALLSKSDRDHTRASMYLLPRLSRAGKGQELFHSKEE